MTGYGGSSGSGTPATVPTGTGFRHVTAGAEDAAAKLVDTADVTDAAITSAKLRNSAAASVIGRSASSVGVPGDIVGTGDGSVLRQSGLSISFGNIPESSVTNLVTDLAAKVAATRLINTTVPLTGGGDLSADRTLAVSDFVSAGASHARGTVPDPGAGAAGTRYLRDDATWQVPPDTIFTYKMALAVASLRL